VSEFLRFGEKNTIAVHVFRWCAGTYLEDQGLGFSPFSRLDYCF